MSMRVSLDWVSVALRIGLARSVGLESCLSYAFKTEQLRCSGNGELTVSVYCGVDDECTGRALALTMSMSSVGQARAARSC